MQKIVLEKILILLEQISNKQKIQDSRLDSLEKMARFQHSEREILEDVRNGQTSLKETLLNHREHIDNKIEDVKGEIIEQGIKTQEKAENTKDKIEEVKQILTK
jgi:uncharacterized protein YwqG